jgi:hypothetical protein
MLKDGERELEQNGMGICREVRQGQTEGMWCSRRRKRNELGRV